MSIEKYVISRLEEELKVIESSGRGRATLPLSKFERAIIYKYTDDGCESLNRNLREGKEMSEFGHFLNSALSKLPDFEKL